MAVIGNAGVLPGAGLVLHGRNALLVVRQGTDAALCERLAQLVEHQDGTALLAAARQASGHVPGPFAILTPVRAGWGALVGAGLELHAEHVGYRRHHLGPIEITLVAPLHLTVRLSGSGNGSPQPGPLSDGRRTTGDGVVVAAQPVLGAAPPLVGGVRCGCGGFAHPLTILCPACGGSLAAPRVLQREPRPPVVRLVIDDGRAIPLNGDVVIGRRPGTDPDVVAGRLTPLTLNDPERTVSRIHAVLALDGWDLLLADRHAENGTAVKPAGVAAFTRLSSGACVRVLPGTTLELGRRRILLDA